MLSLRDKFKYEYNSMYDILYITLKECRDSYGDEQINGIVINYDYNTDEIVGFDIWNFKKMVREGKPINIPMDINFKELYNNI